MHLKPDEIFAALGLAMEKIEAAGASTALTDAVVIVGEIRSAIGNRWNPAQIEAAKRVRAQIKPIPTALDEARQTLKPVIDYVQAVKNHVPIGIVAQTLAVSDLLEKAAAE